MTVLALTKNQQALVDALERFAPDSTVEIKVIVHGSRERVKISLSKYRDPDSTCDHCGAMTGWKPPTHVGAEWVDGELRRAWCSTHVTQKSMSLKKVMEYLAEHTEAD